MIWNGLRKNRLIAGDVVHEGIIFSPFKEQICYVVMKHSSKIKKHTFQFLLNFPFFQWCNTLNKGSTKVKMIVKSSFFVISPPQWKSRYVRGNIFRLATVYNYPSVTTRGDEWPTLGILLFIIFGKKWK